jgi:putative sterol carrier protein
MGDHPSSDEQTRSDAAAEFFGELERRGPEPLLGGAAGSVRFDLSHGGDVDHWRVAVTRGEVAVSCANVGADCVVRADKELFDGVARGEVNAMAALLRGELTAEGDLELLMRLQRLFPGPQPTRGGVRRPMGGGANR